MNDKRSAMTVADPDYGQEEGDQMIIDARSRLADGVAGAAMVIVLGRHCPRE
jgi:hypothetical protein